MNPRSPFPDLARAMPERERRELLERITRTLSLSIRLDDSVQHTQIPGDERRDLIHREIERLDFISRLVMGILSFFTGRPRESVFEYMKLAEIRRRIRRRAPGLVLFDTRQFTHRMAERLSRLASAAEPLAPFFERLWNDRTFLESMVMYLLETKIGSLKTSVTDLLPTDEMRRIYAATERKEPVRQEVLRRLGRYVEQIPGGVYNAVEEGLLPLYYLRDLIRYPFTELLAAFGADAGKSGPDDRPRFRSAPVVFVLEQLEKLYYALYVARKIPEPVFVHPEIFEYYDRDCRRTGSGLTANWSVIDSVAADDIETALEDIEEHMESPEPRLGEDGNEAYRGDDSAEGKTSGDAAESGDAYREAEDFAAERPDTGSAEAGVELKSALRRLIDAVEEFLSQIPYTDLIRYFRSDPYYRMVFYLPSVNLPDFYHAAMKMRFLSELEERFLELKRGMIDELIAEVFDGQPLETFMNYRRYPELENRNRHLSGFSCLLSLRVLYTFLVRQYQGRIRRLIGSVVNAITGRKREVKNRLAADSSGLDNLAEKIRVFDFSLSAESEDGKVLNRVRSAPEHDAAQARIFEAMVTHKNREAKDFIDSAFVRLTGLAESLTEALSMIVRTNGVRRASTEAETMTAYLDERVTEEVRGIERLKKLLSEIGSIESAPE